MSEKFKHEELNLSERWGQLPLPVKSLDTARNEILNVLLIAVSTIAVLPLAASLFRITEIGWQNAMYFQIIAYLSILATTILHRRLSYRFKAIVLILLCFILGSINTANIGLLGSGILFMVFSIILATMFFGVRCGIVLIASGLLLLVIVAYGVKQNWIIFDFSIEIAARSFSSWISKICVFALFSGVLIFSLGRLINYLVDSSEKLKSRTLELKKINDKLIQEIAEKEKAEEALRESERKLNAIFDHHYQLTGLIDTEGKLLAANRTALSFAGVQETEVMGKYFWDSPWWGRSQRSELQNAVKRAVKGEFVRFETTHFAADGQVRNIDFSLSPVRDDNGDVIFVVPEGRDITEIRRAEVERTNLQEQLNQAQKMEAIGTLAGGIAHDFNNILSAIVGYTELSKLSVGNKKQLSEYLENILKAGGRAKDLVQQILAFSRQTEHELKPVSVQLIVEEAIKLLRASLPSSIKINLNITNEALVMADPVQIHQIIMNLCANAGHAMKEAGGTLTVDLSDVKIDDVVSHESSELKPGKYLKLSVSDTGSGMPPEVLEQIFNPFFTTKEREEGTGLGLSVVHGIVKKLEGGIYAQSEPGKGAILDVFLPVLKEIYEPKKYFDEAQPYGKGQVLFVDDEYDIIDIGQRLLESLGYEVVTRISSVEALELFRMQPHRFDLVITDMTMPQLTGDKLAAELISIRKDIPIILCTGFGHQIPEEIAKSIGIKKLLMKPILRADLAKALNEVLNEAKNTT